MTNVETICQIACLTDAGDSEKGYLRLVKVLDREILTFRIDDANDNESFLIEVAPYHIDGKEFNAKAVLGYDEGDTYFFNLPEWLIKYTNANA